MKDAYYFSHDSNAKDDPKCVLLIEQLGLEGYGIYWVLVEILREQEGYKYPLSLIPAMARRYNTTAEKMRTVIMQYGLFEIENDEFFFSKSLGKRMDKKAAVSAARKENAFKRWGENANVMQLDSKSSANAMPVKERKEKERKGNSIGDKPQNTAFSKPSVEEIEAYCTERKNNVDPVHFFDWNESKGWMIGKNKMKDWKAAIRTWEARDKNTCKPYYGPTKTSGGTYKI